MLFKCQECERETKSESGLHRHIKAQHNTELSDYYCKHYPRKNLLTGESLKFKNKKDYFGRDFNTYNELLRWCHNANPEETKKYALRLLKKRVSDKSLKFGPTHLELILSELPTIDIYKKLFGSYSFACNQAGIAPMLHKKIPDDFFETIESDFLKIIVDTREQRPLKFKDCQHMRLDFGDYTAAGSNYDYTYVERKGESDFKSTLSQHYSRFCEELSRANQMDSYIFIVVDSDIRKIRKNNFFDSRPANLKFIFHKMKEICHKFPQTCQFVFSGNRTNSKELIQKILHHGSALWNCDLQYYIDKKNGLDKRNTKKKNKSIQGHQSRNSAKKGLPDRA
tara:strand:- start:924 stop:1937 length:1014 start_codon:yes stop_codon:yes gene_type:complete